MVGSHTDFPVLVSLTDTDLGAHAQADADDILFIDTEGKAIFMKGPQCEEEVEAALERFGGQYRLCLDLPYAIPHTPHRRRLVVFERLGTSI